MSEEDVVLVCGASSDLGQRLIRRLAREHTTILAHYAHSSAELDQIARALPCRVVPLRADFSSLEETQQFIRAIQADFGCPTKVAHFSAPKYSLQRFKQTPWEAFQANIDIQLRSMVCILRAFLPEMAKAQRGKVLVVLSSVTLGTPPKGASAYVATKYALLGLMRALASEYADRRININAISPSMVDTKFLSAIPSQLVELSKEQHPRRQLASPDDVVAAAAFLLSDESSYITGANLPITGGEII